MILRDAPVPDLPAWPLVGMFWTFPIAWVLGLGAFVPLLWGIVMTAHLLLRGRIRAPAVLLAWLLFLALVALSVIMLDTTGRVVGLLFRLGNYYGATVVFVYIYNSSTRTLPDRRIVAALTALWVAVVVGGFLGVVVPNGALSTPAELVLPSSILDNELVRAWVHPRFAEVQQPWGVDEPFARPSAPFPYTNAWGNNYSLLLPFAIAMYSRLARRRALFAALLVASTVPAVATLNRGMFLALGIGLVYAVVRLAGRGRVAALAVLSGVAAAAAAVLLWSGAVDQIVLRTATSGTNSDRALIYEETFTRTLSSPLLGWGGPRPSESLPISVGTQGHVWNVMFSHGFVALVLFVVTLWWMAWRTRRCVDLAFVAHVVLVVGAIATVYYGFDGPQMAVVLAAAGIAMRQADGLGAAPATGDSARHRPALVSPVTR